MSNALLPNETQREFLERLTRENASKPFEEFPKHLYHPDGRSILVNSRAEQSAAGGDWLERPQEAIDEKNRRDKRDSEKFIADVNAEAAEKTGARKK
jgi:hypothetical protein